MSSSTKAISKQFQGVKHYSSFSLPHPHFTSCMTRFLKPPFLKMSYGLENENAFCTQIIKRQITGWLQSTLYPDLTVHSIITPIQIPTQTLNPTPIPHAVGLCWACLRLGPTNIGLFIRGVIGGGYRDNPFTYPDTHSHIPHPISTPSVRARPPK